jgi:hypothetical protein
MKIHLFILLLIFTFSCAKKEPPKREILKKRPPQNSTFLNRVNAQNAEASLERIRILEMGEAKEKSLLETKSNNTQELDEDSYLREREALDRRYGRNNQKIQEKPSSQDFPKNNPRPKEVKQEKSDEILEIAGFQNKNNQFQERSVLAPPISHSKKRDNFTISTSPTYIGKSLDEAKFLLEQFGEVRVVKNGDMFSLKVSPPDGLETEAEAKKFMGEIIKNSFFDVFVEKKF